MQIYIYFCRISTLITCKTSQQNHETLLCRKLIKFQKTLHFNSVYNYFTVLHFRWNGVYDVYCFKQKQGGVCYWLGLLIQYQQHIIITFLISIFIIKVIVHVLCTCSLLTHTYMYKTTGLFTGVCQIEDNIINNNVTAILNCSSFIVKNHSRLGGAI